MSRARLLLSRALHRRRKSHGEPPTGEANTIEEKIVRLRLDLERTLVRLGPADEASGRAGEGGEDPGEDSEGEEGAPGGGEGAEGVRKDA